MGPTKRWLLMAVVALVVFGVCVWLGDVLLPWDRADRIVTGVGAGTVLGGVLAAWAAALADAAPNTAPNAAPDSPGRPPAVPPAPGAVVAGGERSVAVGENSGIIVTGDHGTVQR